jgi:hypothetical protein
LEIGGGHGILARECKKLGDVDWVVLEPDISSIPEESDVKYIRGFFDESYQYDGHFNAIVHSHTLEHIYNPDLFIKHLSELLTENKYCFFSVPNLLQWLKRRYNNTLFFEHTLFLREEYIDYLLSKYNLVVLEKKYFGDGHSIFYACEKGQITKKELEPTLYQQNKEIFFDYIKYYKTFIADIHRKLEKNTDPVYLFGAHIFSQFLIAFGLNIDKISGIIDNSTVKQGKRLYGTNLIVHSPYILQSIEHPVVILKAGAYDNEIKADMKNNINRNIIFLT